MLKIKNWIIESYKRGVLSAIYNWKIRFKNNKSEFPNWEKTNIGSIFAERCERASGNENLLAVTINSGVVKRDEIELKDNSSADKSNYKRVYVNDIAYNTMRMWQGASGVSSYDGIVSPAYTVLYSIDSDNSDVRFWGYYFKTHKLMCEFQRFSQGLASDTWNLKYPQIAYIEVYAPCIDEQRKIADLLDELEKTIIKHKEYLEMLLSQRNKLLQTMFI